MECGSHGVCSRGICQCEEGWVGPTCEERSCHSHCAEHGQCKDGKCECSPGWEGDHCTIGKYQHTLNKISWINWRRKSMLAINHQAFHRIWGWRREKGTGVSHKFESLINWESSSFVDSILLLPCAIYFLTTSVFLIFCFLMLWVTQMKEDTLECSVIS